VLNNSPCQHLKLKGDNGKKTVPETKMELGEKSVLMQASEGDRHGGVNVTRQKSLTHRLKRARKFEKHTERYLQRKYGSKRVNSQKPSRTTRKRPDHIVR
jgi:hypothetical protein